MDGEHLYIVLMNPINDPVAVDADLSNGLVMHLRYNSAYAWMVGKSVGDLKRPVCEHGRDLWRISCDEQTDRLQVIQRLVCPPYFSHCAMRARASSWLTS